MKTIGWTVLLTAIFALNVTAAHLTVDADDIPLASNAYDNGSSGHGGFLVENVHFKNSYNPVYWSWSGFAASNIGDTNDGSWANQYAVFSPGHDVSTNGNYFVAYDDSYGAEADIVTLPVPGKINGLYLNNTTYAARDMMNGSGFSKKFGGASGDDPDWFLLTVSGKDTNGVVVGANAVYLADYRFTNNANDYILSEWTWLSLTNLGENVKTLHFTLSSSDSGLWGMNTPAYFALDGLDVEFQYAPAVGQAGSTAVDMYDTNFLFWADGWQDYNVGSFVSNQFQTPQLATGMAAGTAFDVVSLGRGGSITMTFTNRIADGDGYDFATFENGFDDYYLELGYVEVSSDGINFFRFNNHSLTVNPVPFQGAYLPPTNITGYCSKYRQGYGTPFDLRDLADVSPLLDVNNVRYIRIQDIVGDGSYTDSFGNVIYDPYPTVGSAGVDLDAIGGLNTSHKITAAAGDHGAVSPAGDVYVAVGYDQLIAITPDAHYQVDDVTVNGVNIGATNQVLFAAVQSNQTISATFTNIAPTPAVVAPDHGGIYTEHVRLTFMAQADDPEDGSLTNGFTWLSNVDGMIGTGPHLISTNLSAGAHILTLRAVDGGRATGSVSATITVLADADGDLLPDSWESNYYGNVTSITTTNDNDEDGLDAYAEWMTGGHPGTPGSSFDLAPQAPTNSGAQVVLTWSSMSNRVYSIYRGASLTAPFTHLDTVPGTPPMNVYTDQTAGAAASSFYKVNIGQ